MLAERADRLGRGIADRYEPIVGQDETDWRAGRRTVLDTEQHAGRHIERAVALVEPARRLDLGHLLFGRDVELHALLDQLLLVLGGLLEVDPRRLVGNLLEL